MWHQASIGRIDKQPLRLKTRADLLLNIECALRLPRCMPNACADRTGLRCTSMNHGARCERARANHRDEMGNPDANQILDQIRWLEEVTYSPFFCICEIVTVGGRGAPRWEASCLKVVISCLMRDRARKKERPPRGRPSTFCRPTALFGSRLLGSVVGPDLHGEVRA
jgi:hypothetical protein